MSAGVMMAAESRPEKRLNKRETAIVTNHRQYAGARASSHVAEFKRLWLRYC
jgi:hypothetical protein